MQSQWQLNAAAELGSGGYGRVVRARHITSGQEAAAKLISTSRMKTQAIMKEIALMKRLDHVNIIRMYDVEQSEKKFIIYMELATHGELFSRVIDAGMLPEEQARPYFQQLMSAVKYMHDQRCVHRDLKLENVLLDHHDQCKVCDFGLAHEYAPDAKTDSVLHEICGSKSYCAPEVLKGHGYEGFPTDVWSCGICLFAMLAGFFPLDEASGSDWRFERVKMSAAQGHSTTRTIFNFYDRPCMLSDPVVDLIDNMLSIDPRRRLKTEESLMSGWVCDKIYSNYRGVAKGGMTQEMLDAMYTAEDEAPRYRGGMVKESGWTAPSGPPTISKQKQFYNPVVHEEFDAEVFAASPPVA